MKKKDKGNKGSEPVPSQTSHPKSYIWFCFPCWLQGLAERTLLLVQKDQGLPPCSTGWLALGKLLILQVKTPVRQVFLLPHAPGGETAAPRAERTHRFYVVSHWDSNFSVWLHNLSSWPLCLCGLSVSSIKCRWQHDTGITWVCAKRLGERLAHTSFQSN